jgi:hypothetical protein
MSSMLLCRSAVMHAVVSQTSTPVSGTSAPLVAYLPSNVGFSPCEDIPTLLLLVLFLTYRH